MYQNIDELVDWLVQYHGLKESSREVVRNNLRHALVELANELLKGSIRSQD